MEGKNIELLKILRKLNFLGVHCLILLVMKMSAFIIEKRMS